MKPRQPGLNGGSFDRQVPTPVQTILEDEATGRHAIPAR